VADTLDQIAEDIVEEWAQAPRSRLKAVILSALREARAEALRDAAMLIHETLRDLRGTHKDYKCVCGHMMSDHDISTLGSVFCPAVIQELRGRALIAKVSQ
jgi:hypothetical protein